MSFRIRDKGLVLSFHRLHENRNQFLLVASEKIRP